MFNLKLIEKKGRRVLTTEQIAHCYGASKRRISENFNSNRERYTEGKHYFYLEGDDLKEFLRYGNSVPQTSTKTRNMYLWTEKGALLHAKSLNTDKAWDVYEYLLENYFNTAPTNKEKTASIKVVAMLHSEVGELIAAAGHIENRVQHLENTMTIDYSQQLLLQEETKSLAIEAMGGKGSKAYNNCCIRNKVFSQIWRDYKEYFRINSYRNTPKMDFEKAKEYLKTWKLQGKLLREIEDINSNSQDLGGKRVV